MVALTIVQNAAGVSIGPWSNEAPPHPTSARRPAAWQGAGKAAGEIS